MKYTLTLLASFFTAYSLLAQSTPDSTLILRSDTLKAVTIEGFSEQQYAYGALFTELDTILQTLYANGRLNTVLQQSSSLYIKDYGSSRIATTGIRGTAAEHTQIQWNGLPLNSPTLGLTDLATMPSSIVDRLQISTGSGSALFGSGAIGGVIQMESRPTGQKKPSLQLDQGFGSFSWRQTTFQLRYAKGAWEARSLVYYNETDNRFPFRVGRNIIRYQENARVRLLGAVQDLYWNKKSWSANIHAWYHSTDRQLPPPISRPTDDDRQWDRGFRLVGELNKQYYWGSSTLKTGWIKDFIHFKDFDLVDAKTLTNQWIGEFRQEMKIGKRIQVVGGIRSVASSALSESLPFLWEWRFSSFGLFRANWPRLRLSAQLRQEWVEGYNPPFTPTAGFSYDVYEEEHTKLSFQAQASRGYRVPTLNQRYWQPGGNPNIRPESSVNYEAGITLNYERGNKGHASIILQAFQMQVKDWIYWRPQPGGVWSPENVQHVRNRGLELQIQQHWTSWNWGYQYTWTMGTILQDSNSDLIGRSLFYVPAHKGNIWVSHDLGKGFRSTVNAQYTGARLDISRLRLKPFSTIDASIRWAIQDPEWEGVVWQLRIDNIFNANYQNVINFPMPGRSWKLMLQIRMNKK